MAKILAVARTRVATLYESDGHISMRVLSWNLKPSAGRRAHGSSVSMSSESGRVWSTPGIAGGGLSVWAVWSQRGITWLTGAEWVEIAVLLHLRDGERACVGCDDGVLAIGPGVDRLEGPDSVGVRDEGGLETLGPHSG